MRVKFSPLVVVAWWLCAAEVSALTFDQWRALYFSPADRLEELVSGEAADPDQDLRTNLAEFLDGTSPTLLDFTSLTQGLDPGTFPFVRFRRALAADDGRVALQTSLNLRHWITLNAPTQTAQQTFPTYQLLTWRDDTAPLSTTAVRFLRMRSFRNLGQPLLFAPGELDVEASFGTGGVRLRWSDYSPAEQGYLIERRAAGQTVFAPLATVGADTNSFTDAGATWNSQVVYRVRAYLGAVNGLASPTTGILSAPATDADRDGLDDAWEQTYFADAGGNAAPDLDSDGDGLTNRQEYLLRLHPRLADSNANGLADGLEDGDGDGIGNLDEFKFGLSGAVDDAQLAGLHQELSYDALGRLKRAVGTAAGGPVTYRYDAEGNLEAVGH